MWQLSAGAFLGWSLGSNDASNVFGTAVASRMVSFRTAAALCAIFVVVGAVVGGRAGLDTYSGISTFSLAYFGGGWHNTGTNIWVHEGGGLWNPIPMPVNVRFNSPDINGDLVVNLSDIVYFTQDFYGAYNYRSDFNWDGVINLSDIALMAQGIGAACP